MSLADLIKRDLCAKCRFCHESILHGGSIEPSDDRLILPPPAEMADLLDLAMQGALPRLKQQALQIEQIGEQYQPFVRRLCQLVDEFDEDQVQAHIERYQDISAS